MGCASSRVESGEVVSRCKARRRYMKQAVASRHALAAAHSSYLQALRNTGAALRQFAEGETAQTIDAASSATATPTVYQHRQYPVLPRRSLQPPPPPPPPPPPQPDMSSTESSYGSAGDSSTPARAANVPYWQTTQQVNINNQVHHFVHQPPPPPAPQVYMEYWEQLFRPATAVYENVPNSVHTVRRFEYESPEPVNAQCVLPQRLPHHPPPPPPPKEWDESTTSTTNTTAEFYYDRCERQAVENVIKSPEPQTDDNSSMVSSSWNTKDSVDLALMISRARKDLGCVIRALDEFFLKASAAGLEVSRLLETSKVHFQNGISGVPMYDHHHSVKVFTALAAWGWPSKSPVALSRDNAEMRDECGLYGSHCSTLERIYAWEKKLYEEVRLREFTKVEHDKKVALLRKQELKGEDEIKIEKTKATINKLQSQITVAVQAVETTSAAILKLRDEELYPQLVELSRGLMHMWRSMNECHRQQNYIVQQLRHLDNLASTEATSSYHRQATIQLEAQVTAWYESFCRLIKSQRDYIRALNGWLRLTYNQFKNEGEGYIDNHHLYALCEEWQLALDRLPEQSACGGIKSFITVIHAIVVQQAVEHKLAKKADRLSKELEKKMLSLRNMETRYYDPYATPNSRSSDPRDPLSRKKAKTEDLRRRVEEEKSRHLKAISVSRAMTLNNLQTGLPNVFQAITGFSNVCTQALEEVHNQTVKSCNNHGTNTNNVRRLT